MKTRNNLKTILSIYRKVVKKFPDIGKDDIRIEFEQIPLDIGIAMIDCERYDATGEIIRVPTICIGIAFFGFKEKEREAAMAHELGHYMRYKNFSVDRLRRSTKWIIEYDEIIYTNKRIKKWRLLDDLYADEQAVKAGYGEPLLGLLRKLFKKHYDNLTEQGKEESKVRIANLEKKLGIENV